MIEFWLERIDVDLWLCGKREKVDMIHSLEAPSSWRTSKCNITSSPAWVGGTRSGHGRDVGPVVAGGPDRAALLHFSFSKVSSLICESLHVVVLYYRVFKSIKSIRGACRVGYTPQTRVASQSGRPASIWFYRSFTFLNGLNMNEYDEGVERI
jgi:hypothetical protein